MSGTPFDDALDAALDRLRAGDSIDAVRTSLPPDVTALLETARALASVPVVPAPAGLADNYVIVKAALERAQIEAAAAGGSASYRPWWRRRVSIASLSIPAGIAAAVFAAGVSGAAASMVATGAGSSVMSHVPGWVEQVIPGGDGDETPGGEHGNAVPTSDGNPASPGGDAPGADYRPTLIEVTGTVSDVRGNTFTLTANDGEWMVNVDANTEIVGEILEGATANVTGDVTAQKNLHATSVSATGGVPATPPGNSAKPTPAAGKPEAPGNPNPGTQGGPSR